MMLLSRFWYVVLGLVAGAAVYVVFLAVGQYNRGNELVMKTGLASDSQTVEWAIKIDSRRRLDALLQGSVDPGIQASLGAANDKEKIPAKPRDDCKKALGLLLEKLPQDQKPDAIFAVDRDGRVVAEVGFDMAAAGIDDFELGGFPAVFDALHGYVRDDAWVLGSKLYLVFARPVEVESGQRPIGAVVAIREVNKKYVEDLAKRTRTNLAFYVVPQGKGQKIAYGTGTERFEESQLEPVATEAAKLGDDKSYENDGRSGVRMLRDDLGAMFARLPGDAWDLRAGFAVVRPRAMVNGPMGFLSGADDKDKANVNWFVVGGLVFLGALLGIALTFLEHTLPLRQLLAQADALKAGKADALALAKLRGAFRVAAQSINAGIERLAEKGGSGRKPADLESILGPVPAQPAMSAFAFGLKDSAPALPGARPGPAAGPPPPPRLPPPPAGPHQAPSIPSDVTPPLPRQAPPLKPPPPPPPPPPAPPTPRLPVSMPENDEIEDDDATTVAAIPKEILAKIAEQRTQDGAEWFSVYEDFLRTKKECSETTDGLTFEKFQQTLRKNRDALMQRHGCKRVKFSVYVKEGRASLKATPVKD